MPDVTTALDADNRESNSSVKDICTSPDHSSHVLELKWDHVKDPLDKTITQHTVLSFVSSVFDPIGLVASYAVKARLLLKDIWRISVLKWDDDLPEEIKKQFLEWHSGLHLLGSLTIPRSYLTLPFDRKELNMFGDSSQDISVPSLSFVRDMLDRISLCVWQSPRCAHESAFYLKLEPQAALLVTRLKEEFLKCLTSKATDIFMWADSITVLQWLNSCNKVPVFVGNRTGEILESTTTVQWHHILSRDNPADTGTRGISSEALEESIWVNGPSILRTTDWPFKPNTRVTDKIRLKEPSCDIDICLENSSIFVVYVLTEKNLPFGKWERLNSIVKYKRTVAFLLRWLPSRKHFRSSVKEITDPCEIDIVEQKLIYLSQGDTFASELKLLRSGKIITRNSRIAKYSPFIGPADILRSTERISQLVDSDFDSKHPIILDARHAIVRLLVKHFYARNFDQGLDYMRAVVNLKYVV